jgi:hypothetical protein
MWRREEGGEREELALAVSPGYNTRNEEKEACMQLRSNAMRASTIKFELKPI